MGKRGVKPRPVETLRLLGSSEQYRRRGEVAVVPGEPVKPNLGPQGSEMWDRRVEQLRNQGILSEAWQETLATLCMVWQECCDAMVDGSDRKERLAAMAAFWKFASDFGLTPASKTGVRIGEPGLPKNRKGYIKRA